MNVREKKHKRVTLFIHITGWGLIFGLPLLFSDHSSPDALRRYLWSSLIPLALLIVFYTNYTLLIDKFLFKRGQMPYFFVVNFILIVGVSLALFAIRHYFISRRIPPPPESTIEAFFGFFFRDMVPLILSVGMSIAVKMTNRWISVEKELETVEREKVEAELKTLKSQLNPHFLFNTLNNIYSLIALSPEKAATGSHRTEQTHALCSLRQYAPIRPAVERGRLHSQLRRTHALATGGQYRTFGKVTWQQLCPRRGGSAALYFAHRERLQARHQQHATVVCTHRPLGRRLRPCRVSHREQPLSQRHRRQKRFGHRPRQPEKTPRHTIPGSIYVYHSGRRIFLPFGTDIIDTPSIKIRS